MQSLTQPELLLKPFAQSGDKNSIPSTNTDAQNPQLADLTNGFPPITSEDPSDGGLPPERKDLNGLGYLTTTYDYFYQAGGRFTFNPTISSAIGGYPLNAALWYTDNSGNSTLLRSTVANNTNNFNNGNFTGWQQEIPVLGWSNTWTGSNTFSGSVSLSGSLSASQTARQTIFGWCAPDYQNADETNLGSISSGHTYTATTNGTLHVVANGNRGRAAISFIKSDNSKLLLAQSVYPESSSTIQAVWVYAKAGQKFELTGAGSLNAFFCPVFS